jgi:hypothetical protein
MVVKRAKKDPKDLFFKTHCVETPSLIILLRQLLLKLDMRKVNT